MSLSGLLYGLGNNYDSILTQLDITNTGKIINIDKLNIYFATPSVIVISGENLLSSTVSIDFGSCTIVENTNTNLTISISSNNIGIVTLTINTPVNELIIPINCLPLELENSLSPTESTTKKIYSKLSNQVISIDASTILNKRYSDNSLIIGNMTTKLIYNSFFFENSSSSIYTSDTITQLMDTLDINNTQQALGDMTNINFWFGVSQQSIIASDSLSTLNQKYINSKPKDLFILDCFPEGYVYFIYPETFGSLSFKVSGMLTNSFISSILIRNGQRFLVYKSMNKQYSSNLKIETY